MVGLAAPAGQERGSEPDVSGSKAAWSLGAIPVGGQAEQRAGTRSFARHCGLADQSVDAGASRGIAAPLRRRRQFTNRSMYK